MIIPDLMRISSYSYGVGLAMYVSYYCTNNVCVVNNSGDSALMNNSPRQSSKLGIALSTDHLKETL